MTGIQKYYSHKETQYLTHGFHEYPARLIPQIAKTLVQEYTQKDDFILDPFCGSGTVLVEANLAVRNAIGVDLNPLGCLISRVKTTPLNKEELENNVKKLLKDLYKNLDTRDITLNDFLEYNIVTPNVPEFPKRDYWFQENALTGLGTLKALIEKIENENIREFCLVGVSSIIKTVSDATTLYHLTKRKTPRNVYKQHIPHAFTEKIKDMVKAMQEYTKAVNPGHYSKIICADSRRLKDTVNERVRCIITRPPNVTLDFTRTYKIYYWWLPLVDNILKLDSQMIGTHRIKEKNVKETGIRLADEVIEKLNEKNAKIVSKYYIDMQKAFKGMHDLLKDGGICCVYAVDSKIQNTSIQCPDVYCKLAREAGFTIENRVQRTPKKSIKFMGDGLTEELLIFKKN